jgi:hypothetical protein
MPPAITTFNLTATFDDDRAAQRAADALRRAGFATDQITLDAPRAAPAAHTETRFLWRIVLIVVWWSIVGTAIGAAIGWGIWALGIGPDDTTGLVLQLISWGIFGHLIAGMWAGYLLLADRSKREFSPTTTARTDITLTVRCTTREQLQTARRALTTSGATSIDDPIALYANSPSPLDGEGAGG